MTKTDIRSASNHIAAAFTGVTLPSVPMTTNAVTRPAQTPGPLATQPEINQLGREVAAQRAADAERDRLLAINVELLAALREIADVSRHYISHMDADDIVALDRARAAIARAKGDER